MHTEQNHTYADVVIIGGGISGLYTALRYLEIFPTTNILLLEASSYLGGRLKTYYDKQRKYQYETGGSRFNQHHKLVLKLVRKYKCTPLPISSNKSLCTQDAMLKSIAEKWKTPVHFKKLPAGQLKQQTFGEYLSTNYSPEERALFQTSFGYDGEFNVMNAYDAIRIFERDFSQDANYYMIQEGFTTLIQRMVEDIRKKGGHIRTNCKVESFVHNKILAPDTPSRFIIYTSYGEIRASKLFIALPKSALQHIDPISTLPWINTVESIPLHRIYAKFTSTSPYLSKRVTTELPIRQYIPTHPELKMAMVSYSDTQYAEKWHELYVRNETQFKKELINQLETLFNIESCHSFEDTKPIHLRWIRSYYWPEGVHLWKANVDSTKIRKTIMCPYGMRTPCYIIGEAYSANQGWVEGALETVEEVFEKYL